MYKLQCYTSCIKFFSKFRPLQCQLFCLLFILNLSSTYTIFFKSLPIASTIPSNLFCHSRFFSGLGLHFPSSLPLIIFNDFYMVSDYNIRMCQLLTTEQPQPQSHPELFPLKNLSLIFPISLHPVNWFLPSTLQFWIYPAFPTNLLSISYY